MESKSESITTEKSEYGNLYKRDVKSADLNTYK